MIPSGWIMSIELKPLMLIGAWIFLGASVGFVATHTFVGMMKGVRTIWPVAFLFTITGWLAFELPGMVGGLICAGLMGWIVARVS